MGQRRGAVPSTADAQLQRPRARAWRMGGDTGLDLHGFLHVARMFRSRVHPVDYGSSFVLRRLQRGAGGLYFVYWGS